MATTMNNNTRKTLASQIDRLDVILDGLAENLNDAVATAAAGAVKEVVSVAVQEAVHFALVEILSNTEVQKRLAASQAVNVQASLPLVVRLATKASTCWRWLTEKAHKAREQAARHARTGWMLGTALAGLARRYRKQLMIAAGMGILVGVTCYLGGRKIASIGCSLAGFVGSLASDTLSRLRRMVRHRLACTS